MLAKLTYGKLKTEEMDHTHKLSIMFLTNIMAGDRIPVGAGFFAHVQNGPEVHPASCTMGTRSFPGVKRPRRGADHPPPSSAEVKKM
jgi:hypothetical protein